MSWYVTNNTATKELDQLIEAESPLSSFLNFADFLQILKAYSPKLLDYFSKSETLGRDMVNYITVAPTEQDSADRKFKFPLLAIQMVESETTCVINSFFKEGEGGRCHFLVMFWKLVEGVEEVLPILGGYFLKFNVVMQNNRYRQVIDLVYANQEVLHLLASHCYSQALTNILMIYLNLDMTKNPQPNPERLTIKVNLVKALFDKIRIAYSLHKQKKNQQLQEIIIENISQILVEIIEKYYLISDGKNMLDVILAKQNVELMANIMMDGSSVSNSIFNVVVWLVRYYSLSSFNTEENNPELSRRNMERLQSQPFIKKIIQLLPQVNSLLSKTSKLRIYHHKLIEIFTMSLSLASPKLVETVKQQMFIQLLIELVFKYQHQTILHKTVEKVFFCIFNNDRKIYAEYHRYLFCKADLINLTACKYLNLNQNTKARRPIHEGYFGHLMQIIKTYSKIQTNDEEVNKSILEKSDQWTKFTQIFKSYELFCNKQLGSYQNSTEQPTIEFIVRYASGLSNKNLGTMSQKVLDEINKEESMQNLKSQSSGIQVKLQPTNMSPTQQIKQKEVQNLFKVPSMELPSTQKITAKQQEPSPSIVNYQKPEQSETDKNEPKESKFEEYLSKQKVAVEKQIRVQRAQSGGERLSANKNSRVTSPSPKKNRSKWDKSSSKASVNSQNQTHTNTSLEVQNPKRQKLSLTTSTVRPPKPHQVASPVLQKQREKATSENEITLSNNSGESFSNQRSVSNSQFIEPNLENSKTKQYSKSAVDFGLLQNVKIKKERVERPEITSFRRVQKKDYALFQFLGLKY